MHHCIIGVFSRTFSTQTWERVDSGTEERRSAATRGSTGKRRREINKEYCSLYAWLILCHEAVQNIYPVREHRNPIHYLYVLTSTVAS
jgi:hypothetical protein